MFENATVSGTEISVIVIVFVLTLAPAAVTALKGHLLLFVAGFFVYLVWPVAAFRLAKPNSAWARRYYDAEKLERSRARYPDIGPSDPDRSKLALAIGGGLLAASFVAGIAVGLSGG
jgi:hypothetical protein